MFIRALSVFVGLIFCFSSLVAFAFLFQGRTWFFLYLAGRLSSMHVLVLFKGLRHELTKSCHDERGVFSFNSHGHVFVHG